MRTKRTGPADPAKQAQILAEMRRERDNRLKGYRDRALKIFPHICGRCGRSFSGRRLPELTVHHKDRNPENNPPDGGNWELLCLYCHEAEHEQGDKRAQGDGAPLSGHGAAPIANPFEALDSLLKKDDKSASDKSGLT